ncbi:MAG: AmmeMemoRadiSam system radical SAM enzyme [Candidatus Portnoybacteria bacterium]|nr:AmmeMemoRadiSam system radical SAM enzyme [Candidatus Portnoybacteria bacterium]
MKKFLAILFLIAIVSSAGYLIFKKEKQVELMEGSLHPAKYYQALDNNMVQCLLCPNKCILSEGQRGICRVRQNINGQLYSLVYGQAASINLDPIEKKPFFHFLPGSKAFSIATAGCNLQCIFCQNWQISQVFPEDIQVQSLSPAEVVEQALARGAQSIAYTYSEPIVFYEYILETAKLAREKGLKNVVVTAGYINEQPLRELCQYVDAIKIDLKAFRQSFYDKMTGGEIARILENLKIIKEEETWLEIVNLVIPGENDSPEEIQQMAEWIKDNLGEEVPLHFTRFYPMYKLQNLPPTPEETLKKAREIALEVGLKYVYTGNIGNIATESTYCPASGALAIKRHGHFVLENNLENGRCPDGQIIPGVWE